MKAEVIWNMSLNGSSVSVKLEGNLVMQTGPLDPPKQTYSLSLVMEKLKRPTVYFTTQENAVKVGEMGSEKGCWSKVEINIDKDHDKECNSPKQSETVYETRVYIYVE